jgi:hypothetical protein
MEPRKGLPVGEEEDQSKDKTIRKRTQDPRSTAGGAKTP